MNLNNEKMKELKVLLIDDEEEILNLLELVLRKEGFEKIFKVKTGSEGIQVCHQEAPDFVVLDVMLHDIDGFEVCEKIREFSLCPIIFLSARTDDFDRLLGLRIGGDDYMTKPFSPKEVAFKIKAYFRRAGYLTSNHLKVEKQMKVIHFGEFELDLGKGELRKDGAQINLTAKEFQLLTYLIQQKNQILSKHQLLENVWGSDFEGYDNTLMVHMRMLRSKIEVDPSKPTYIQTVRGLGYKFVIGD